MSAGPLRSFDDALYSAPAAGDAAATMEGALGLAVPEPLAAFLAGSDGAAFMEPTHGFLAYFPDGQVTAVLQWIHGAGEIVEQTKLWRAPSGWSGDGGPALPHRMIVFGSAIDEFDRGVLIADLRSEAVLPGAVVYRRLGFDPALSEIGEPGAFGYVAPDVRGFLELLGTR